MHFWGSNATLLLLLLLAFAGCQAAPPFGPKATSKLTFAVRRLPPLPQSPAQVDGYATLVDFEEPESVPAPANEESNQSKPMTLDDLEGMAFQNNPTLASALARIESARGKQVQAGLFPNPVFGYQAMQVGEDNTAGQQGAFASQQFITAGKLGLDQAIAGKVIDEAHIRFHAQEQRVLTDVQVRFYEALVAQRRVELTKELAQIGSQIVIASEKLLEGRLGTENDLLQAQIRADESQILQANAFNGRQEAWKRLSVVIGVPNMNLRNLSGTLDIELPAYRWEECLALAVEDNPELQAARIRVEAASIAIRRAVREPIPNVDLSAGVMHDNATKFDIANVQLGIPLPVFNKNQGRIQSADAEWIVAHREVERIELDLQDRLAVAFRRYANARQQVETYRERILPRASKSLKLVTEGYKTGQVEYLLLLTAQQTYIQVNLSYLDALREFRASAAIIEGRLLMDSLTSQ